MEDIYKKPEPRPEETFFQLTYDTKTSKEMHEVLLAWAKAGDIQMISVIFKKCKHHDVRIRAGKILYYDGS